MWHPLRERLTCCGDCQKWPPGVGFEKWDFFWANFERQWIPIVDTWNICHESIDQIKLNNRTNNGLERFNRELNAAFPPHPNMLNFIGGIEMISGDYVKRVLHTHAGNAERNVHL